MRDGETLTGDGVRAFAVGQIAHNKIPRYVRFVSDFPMTVAGKVQKFKMRQTVEEQLGLKRGGDGVGVGVGVAVRSRTAIARIGRKFIFNALNGI